MVGLVVVSHSRRAAEGIVEVASEMAGDVALEAVGGDGHGGIGTVPDDIADALRAAADADGEGDAPDSEAADGVVVLVDLGSAVMNAEVAIETSDVDATVADAPVLEGAVNAAVAATDPTATVESVREQAEAASDIGKL